MEALALVAKASSRHSLFKGVTLYKPTSKWRAQISHGGRTVTLGDYSTEEEAARVFDRACICKYGKDAVCNFPVDDYKDEWEELLSTTIPALLVKFKEERQRNKVNRTAAASRSASMPPGVSAPPSAIDSAPQPLTRPRQPAKITQAASRQLPPQPHQGPPPPPYPGLSSKGITLATVTAAPFGIGYALEGDCTGAAAATATAKHGAQGPMGHLNERDRKYADEFLSRGALSLAAAAAMAAPHGIGHCQRDSRHQAFPCQHRLAVSSGEQKMELGELDGADFAMAANAPSPSSPAGVRRRAAPRPVGASTDGAAGASPLMALPRASSSPNLDNVAPALWKARSLPNTASAPDWSTPEAAALTEEMMAAWDGAAVATRQEVAATASARRPLPLPPLSRMHGNSRYPASWSRSEDHNPAEIWEGAIAAEPMRMAAASRRRVVHVISAARRTPPAEEFRAGSKRGKGAIEDELTYQVDSVARVTSDRLEARGSPPMATTRRRAGKRPEQEADAEVLEAEEMDCSLDNAAPAASGPSTAPMAHAGRGTDRRNASPIDIDFDPTYTVAMARGAFGRTRPTERQAGKRMRPGAAAAEEEEAMAPMRAGEESLGTTTTTSAATEEDCGRPSSKSCGEEAYGPSRRWHGPITPAAAAAAAWYAAAAAGAGMPAAAAALPRGMFWGPAWPQRLVEQEPYAPAMGRGPASARRPCSASAGPFITAPAAAATAAAAAAALAAAEDLSVEELHQVLLSALQRREQQLIKQQLQQQQSIRWQQQEALVRLVEASGLRPVLPSDTVALLDELSATAGEDKRIAWHGSSGGAAGGSQFRKRAAGDGSGASDKLYEFGVPAAQMRATRQLAAPPLQLPAPPQQQRKSNGGGAVAAPPPRGLLGSAVTPDSPTSSSSGGGGGTRDVRFLTDVPTPATAPPAAAIAATTTAAPANKSHHLSPTVPRRTHADSDVNLGADCAGAAATDGGCSGHGSHNSADRSDAHNSALDGKAAPDAAQAAATTSNGGDTVATGPLARPCQKWRFPDAPPYVVRERERAPTVRVSFGRDAQYDSYASTSTAAIDDGHSIEVPLLLRVPSSMQQQLLGMLQLQLADASQQSQPQLVRTQSLGAREEGRSPAKARRIELVSEE
ncbi:hypothetical protein Vafri_5013 [Volvox africanus]|uniref:AP2/ERF domain-containing protein n=1 Tax=Volvox africanus TaxID=51714 RepID=A0A8J4AZQ0_9CHLO|nr:hypothetical protein Vafri_5013 [Volvox africanus]